MGSGISGVPTACSARNGAVCPSPSAITHDIPTLPAGGEVEFTYAAQVGWGASGANTTIATVAALDELPGANNEARLVVNTYTPDVLVSASVGGQRLQRLHWLTTR